MEQSIGGIPRRLPAHALPKVSEVIGHADQDRFVPDFAQIPVVIHVVAGICQISRILPGRAHGILLAFIFRYGNGHTERVDLLIFRSAHSPRISGAEKKELRGKGRIRHDHKEIIDMVGAFDKIKPAEQPGIGDLRIGLLILRRKRFHFLCLRISQHDIRILPVKLPALFFRHRSGAVLRVILYFQLIIIGIPVIQQPLIGRILPDRG